MLKEGKIGVQEAIWLTTIAITSKVFFSSPANLAGLVGTAGWYTTLISAAVTLAAFWFIYLLLKRFPGKGIVEIFELVFGHIIGTIFSLILALYMLFTVITRISEFNEVMKIYVFSLSPNWFILGIFVLCIICINWLGFETIARTPKLLVYLMLLGFIVVLLLGMQNYKTEHLFPILGHGIGKSLLVGLQRSSVYGEVILLAVFAGSLQGTENIKKEGIVSIIISAVILSVSIFVFTLTFPYNVSEEITAPMYELATLVDYGRFLQRVEPIFLFIWILGTLISASIIFYSFVYLFCGIFKINDKRPVIIPTSIIVFTSAFMHKNIIVVSHDNVSMAREFGSLVVYVPSIIALIIAVIRKKGGSSNA